MESDQCGSRPRDPRHVYSNPTTPEIYPIPALGVYWSSYGVDDNDLRLLPGNGQYERFRKVFGRVLKTTSIASELERRGTSATDIGIHSMRKGTSTFYSSGSIAYPPAVTVHLRAGWPMGGVQDCYLRHDAAGDMFVGRTVTGLPILQPEFAVLPPHFAAGAEITQSAKGLCFPGLPESVEYVAEFALAFLINHIAFLREDLSNTHPLFQSALFTNVELIESLRLIADTSGSGSAIQPTGVPPHVTIMTEIRETRNELRKEIIARKADMQKITESQDALCVINVGDLNPVASLHTVFHVAVIGSSDYKVGVVQLTNAA